MIYLEVTESQLERAQNLYPFNELKGSISKGWSNIYGAIGEVVIYDYFKNKTSVEFKSTYDYDMIIDGYKVDVKTKQTTVTPQPYYFCSIAKFNTTQDCDYYFFCRVKKDYSSAWIIGYITPKEFYKKAVFKKKGDLDTNGWKFAGDSYHVPVSELNKFKEAKQNI